ncbi:MAG: MarR family winged helix-turn-helix transcriptional regulator [Actinomycetales bacterium]
MATVAHDLHVLVSVMGRHAEVLLSQSGIGLTYRRFLVLVQVAELGGATQRELADRAGASEAAMSRMVAGLSQAGLVQVQSGPGRRRLVRLTSEGERRLRLGNEVLGDRFDALVRSRGVEPTELQTTIRTLIAGLQKSGVGDPAAEHQQEPSLGR